jgi:hypothetical protein
MRDRVQGFNFKVSLPSPKTRFDISIQIHRGHMYLDIATFILCFGLGWESTIYQRTLNPVLAER